MATTTARLRDNRGIECVGCVGVRVDACGYLSSVSLFRVAVVHDAFMSAVGLAKV